MHFMSFQAFLQPPLTKQEEGSFDIKQNHSLKMHSKSFEAFLQHREVGYKWADEFN